MFAIHPLTALLASQVSRALILYLVSQRPTTEDYMEHHADA
jgi:hypothetical protein